MNDSIVDADVRSRALNPGCSFICAAPAGSGKTELLTQRLLTLLARVSQPEGIVAITFTRKAATEMRDRVLNAIRQSQQQPRPQARHQALTWDLARKVLAVDKANQWHLLTMPNRLQIRTFDSLCSSLANSLPSHTSFASPPLIAEDPQVLYQQAAEALLQSLEDNQPWSAAIGNLLQLMDNNTQKLANLLAAMLARREAWLPVIGSGTFDKLVITEKLQQNLQCVREETVQKLITAIPRPHRQTLLELAGSAATNLARTDYVSPILHCVHLDRSSTLPTADEQGIQQWMGLTELLIKKDNHWRKTVDRRTGFPPGEDRHEKVLCKQQKQRCLQLIADLSQQSGLLDLLLEVRYLPSTVYDQDQAALLQTLLEVLPVLAGYLQVGFRTVNSVDFAEVSIRARLALAAMESPTELALALDYKIQHLLVDEFQDVSSSQFELLTLLMAGWQVNDGRSVFLVGDPMQSIYGFRHANVGLFLQCGESGIANIPLERLHLAANFRSQAGIVDWINAVFSHSFPGRDDIAVGAVSYFPSAAVHPSLAQPAACFHGFAEDTDDSDEARAVLDIIRQSRLNNPEGTIAILVRNRRHAGPIISLLEEVELSYRAVDLDPLAANIVIQDLISLTRALLHPADKIAWLSVLRAPWCGLSLADLERIANFHRDTQPLLTVLQQLIKLIALPLPQTSKAEKNPQASAAVGVDKRDDCDQTLSVDGQSRLARVAPILATCVAQTQRQSLRPWIEGAWIALGGPACMAGRRDFKNAERYFSLLESLELSTLIKDCNALEQVVQTLYAAPDPDSDGRLQIMTIHKAKGLEFDTVILPSLERSPRSSEPELLLWDERLSLDGEPFLLMSPITSSGKEKDPIYSHLARQDKRRQLSENTRLLYVACTRARHYLYLLARVKTDQKETDKKGTGKEGAGKKESADLRQPAQSSLLYTVWSALKPEIHLYQKKAMTGGKKEGIEQETAAKPHRLQRLHSQWQLPALQHEHLLADYIPYYNYDNRQPLPSTGWQDPTSRYVGIVVHRVLQRCTLNALHASHWRQHRSYWQNQLQALGTPNPSLEQATEKVIATLESVSADTSVHWLFADTHLRRETEYPITFASTEGIRHYIVDLLVIDKAYAWIVDYKTAQPDSDQAIDQFIAQEMTKYHDIMQCYGKAVVGMGYKHIKLALYFPMISHFAKYE